jgi:hypothetical protein
MFVGVIKGRGAWNWTCFRGNGYVPRHGGERGIGYNEGVGRVVVLVVLVGGGERNAGGHTGDEKTTKRWEADDRARDRLK